MWRTSWRTVVAEKDFSSSYVGRVTLRIGILRNPLKASYLPTMSSCDCT